MSLAFAGPAIAIGSGRAAIWATFVPAVIRQGAATAMSILTAFLTVSALVFVVSLGLGIGTGATMLSQLHLSVGEGVVYAIANAGFLPNASLFTGAFLTGPGFAVGANTLVSPGAVVLGPLPLFPLLAALPREGVPGFLASVAGLAACSRRHARRHGLAASAPDDGLARGCVARVRRRYRRGGRLRRTRLPGGWRRRTRTHAARRSVRARGAGRRHHGIRSRWASRRLGHHLVAAPRRARLRRVTTRLVVLVSGAGTNLQALIDACADPAYGAKVVAVGADRDDIEGLARADRAGIPTFVRKVSQFTSREHWDRAMADSVAGFEPDLVVLAGFMKLVSEDFLARHTTVNTHPALCPSFPGMHGPADALAYGVKVTGATLFIVDGGVDTGPIIAQTVVPVIDDDSVESLHERIKAAERTMLVDTVGLMARDGWELDGRRVRLG